MRAINHNHSAVEITKSLKLQGRRTSTLFLVEMAALRPFRRPVQRMGVGIDFENSEWPETKTPPALAGGV
jgi:hypothetical protein